jgi:hypothetical protein
MNLKEKDMRMWTGSVWFMIGFNGGAMWTQQGTFGFRKRRENCDFLSECQFLEKGSVT